jgi:hypothetical protein
VEMRARMDICCFDSIEVASKGFFRPRDPRQSDAAMTRSLDTWCDG